MIQYLALEKYLLIVFVTCNLIKESYIIELYLKKLFSSS